MKTYTEHKGKESFDWNAFLNKETYTLEELINAKMLANSWITCACGNQCEIIPRNETGSPCDIILYELGLDFSYAISESIPHNCFINIVNKNESFIIITQLFDLIV